MHMHHPYLHVKYSAYMPKLMGIFVSCTYLASTGELEVVFGCVLAHICRNVAPECPYSMLVMWAVFGMWQPYLFSEVCQICVQYFSVNLGSFYFICGTYMWIHCLYIHGKYLAFITYMHSFGGTICHLPIFGSDW